jgi:hypothetical protein
MTSISNFDSLFDISSLVLVKLGETVCKSCLKNMKLFLVTQQMNMRSYLLKEHIYLYNIKLKIHQIRPLL